MILAFGQIGVWQLLIVVVLVLVLFGGVNKIPALARSLGRAKGEFKKGLAEGEKAAAEAAADPTEAVEDKS